MSAERPVAIVLANPHAGGGRARQSAVEALWALREAGVDARLALPATLQEMKEQAREACAGRPGAVLACGGDGTVHQVLQAAVPASTPLGIIPAGTGNDIARALGIDVRSRQAWVRTMAEMILSGRTAPVDLARITIDDQTVWSMGVTSTGFDSAVNERADRMPVLQGTARYVAALLGELRSFALHDYDVTIDGEPVSGRALLIAIGNGSSYGGGMRICPAADMSDGLLDITWVAAAPRRTVLKFFPRVFSGGHVDHPLVTTFRAKSISLAARGPVVYTDGERIGPPPMQVEAVPEALRVLRP